MYKYVLLPLTVILLFSSAIKSQTSIEWQKSIGTENYDAGLKIINDEDGNFIIFGTEQHEDITGGLRTYMITTKYDVDGNEIWSRYHDVSHNTNTIAFDYYIGNHFYTEESGQRIINLVMDLSGTVVLYKVYDSTGGFAYYDYLGTPVMHLDRDGVRVIASTLCSIQQSCYGPDSMVVQMINPIPDSVFNTIEWTFGMKQNIRTSPIQGHYDFNHNDIAVDEDGNIYLATQIQRWDFQFCTDCGDAFVDAYNMIFKFNPEGELVDQHRLNITTAVVSHMEILAVSDGDVVVRINDINSQGTAVVASIFYTDYDLNIQKQYTLDRAYNYMAVDNDLNLYTVTNAYDPADPNIIGASDVMISKFDEGGELQWRAYYGGTSFDFPKGFVLTEDDGIVFMANTESNDFDVEENHGYQDIWLVKLSTSVTSVEDEDQSGITVYPNPATDVISVNSQVEIREVRIFDPRGREVGKATTGFERIATSSFAPGKYFVEVECVDDRRETFSVVKM